MAFANQYQSCVGIPNIFSDNDNGDFIQSDTLYGRVKSMVAIGDSGTFEERCKQDKQYLSFEFNSDVLATQANNNNPLRFHNTLYDNNSIVLPSQILRTSSGGNGDAYSSLPSHTLPNIRLTVKRFGSTKLCLTMPTIYGAAPLTCKSVKALTEQEGGGVGEDGQKLIDENDIVPECTFYAPTCMEDRFNSQTLLNFSGRAVQCLRDTLDSVFFSTPFCPSTSKLRQTPLNPFPEFQKTMQKAVIALITIYIIFFGMMMLLEPFRFDPKQAIHGALKIIFVIYFAIGIGTTQYKDGRPYTANGVVEWGLPIFTQAASGFATFVFSSVNGNGLCSFDPRNYNPGKEYYALWDSLDCRVGVYFGILPNLNIGRSLQNLSVSRTNPTRPVQELFVTGELSSNNEGSGITLADKTGEIGQLGLDSDFSLRFFTAMWGYLLVGSLLVVVSCLSFIIVFLTLLFKLLTTFLLSMITLYVLAYFSPIFVPMALFDRTKGYFQGWLKMCLSCAVRPAIIAGFIALLVIVYDGVFFRDCQFVKYTYSDGTAQFHTFNMAFLNNPGEPVNACSDSMGYRLLKKYLGYDWDYISLLIIKIYYVTDGWVALESVAYLLLWTMVFFFFGQTMEGLASDISGGPSMESLTGGMYTLLKTLRQALSVASSVASKVGSGAKAVGGMAIRGGVMGAAGLGMAGKYAGKGIAAGAGAAADTKVGRAVVGGAQAVGGAVKGVAGSVGGGISKGAKAVGNTKVGRGMIATGKGIAKGAKATGRGVATGARAVSSGAKGVYKAGKSVSDALDPLATSIERGVNTAKRATGSKVKKMKVETKVETSKVSKSVSKMAPKK